MAIATKGKAAKYAILGVVDSLAMVLSILLAIPYLLVINQS